MRKLFTFLLALAASVGMSWAATVTWDNGTLSSIEMFEGGQSFTEGGVTVTVLDALIEGEFGEWRGYSGDVSFKFSTSLGNFTKIEITGTIYMLGGSGWTLTSPGAVWTGDANETTFGQNFDNVSQIVFTIEPSGGETAVDNIQIDKAQSTKLIRNGMLLIEKNGKIYNVMGTEVK